MVGGKDPMCRGRHSPWAMRAPFASISPVEKSSDSLMTNERAVRTTVTAISSATAVRAFFRSSIRTGSRCGRVHRISPPAVRRARCGGYSLRPGTPWSPAARPRSHRTPRRSGGRPGGRDRGRSDPRPGSRSNRAPRRRRRGGRFPPRRFAGDGRSPGRGNRAPDLSSENPRARRRTFTISTLSPSWERWPYVFSCSR